MVKIGEMELPGFFQPHESTSHPLKLSQSQERLLHRSWQARPGANGFNGSFAHFLPYVKKIQDQRCTLTTHGMQPHAANTFCYAEFLRRPCCSSEIAGGWMTGAFACCLPTADVCIHNGVQKCLLLLFDAVPPCSNTSKVSKWSKLSYTTY